MAAAHPRPRATARRHGSGGPILLHGRAPAALREASTLAGQSSFASVPGQTAERALGPFRTKATRRNSVRPLVLRQIDAREWPESRTSQPRVGSRDTLVHVSTGSHMRPLPLASGVCLRAPSAIRILHPGSSEIGRRIERRYGELIISSRLKCQGLRHSAHCVAQPIEQKMHSSERALQGLAGAGVHGQSC